MTLGMKGEIQFPVDTIRTALSKSSRRGDNEVETHSCEEVATQSHTLTH